MVTFHAACPLVRRVLENLLEAGSSGVFLSSFEPSSHPVNHVFSVAGMCDAS